MAGILTKEDNTTNSGTPGLSELPFIKYFFGSVNHEVSQDEIVFVLVPHIVRESTLTGLNTRSIDTGTSNDIEIRRSAAQPGDNLPLGAAPAPAPATNAASAASAMVQQMKQQAMPPVPGVPGSPAAARPAPPQRPARSPHRASAQLHANGGQHLHGVGVSDERA